VTPPTKPPVRVESLGPPMSVRFTPTDREQLEGEARARGLEPAVFVRMLAMDALRVLLSEQERQASLGILGTAFRASPQTLGASPQMLAVAGRGRRG